MKSNQNPLIKYAKQIEQLNRSFQSPLTSILQNQTLLAASLAPKVPTDIMTQQILDVQSQYAGLTNIIARTSVASMLSMQDDIYNTLLKTQKELATIYSNPTIMETLNTTSRLRSSIIIDSWIQQQERFNEVIRSSLRIISSWTKKNTDPSYESKDDTDIKSVPPLHDFFPTESEEIMDSFAADISSLADIFSSIDSPDTIDSEILEERVSHFSTTTNKHIDLLKNEARIATINETLDILSNSMSLNNNLVPPETTLFCTVIYATLKIILVILIYKTKLESIISAAEKNK